MKAIIFMSVFLSVLATEEAMAVCPTVTSPVAVRSAALTTLLPGKMVCKRNTANTDWDWQEYHSGTSGAANNLIDYKKGSNPVDPTKPVGSWSILTQTVNRVTTATVTYNYGTGGTYTYSVWAHGTGSTATYDFCSATGDVLGATLKTVSVASASP